jgi:hypothetical protein
MDDVGTDTYRPTTIAYRDVPCALWSPLVTVTQYVPSGTSVEHVATAPQPGRVDAGDRLAGYVPSGPHSNDANGMSISDLSVQGLWAIALDDGTFLDVAMVGQARAILALAGRRTEAEVPATRHNSPTFVPGS